MDPLAYLFGLEQFGIKFGLDNISAIVARLGHPELAFASVHIAGTNGKGSVTAMVDATLRAAGHRSARYTSPHLVDLAERFVIDGRPVDHDALVAAVADVRDVVDGLRADGALDVQPTFFEVTTAVAFELFRRAGVEVAVLEVGLGGRLDATNVVSPLATAITSIAFDLQLYLGTTLREIALEKAGIIKPGVPVVVGALDPEALDAIAGVARERGAENSSTTSASDVGGISDRPARARISAATRRSPRGCSHSSTAAASRFLAARSPTGSRTRNGRAVSIGIVLAMDASCCSTPRTIRPAQRRSRPTFMTREAPAARSCLPRCGIRMSRGCSRRCCRPWITSC